MSAVPSLAALEFASPWMLPWLAAAALPWLINLWMRRRHVETPWAAVELLMTAVRERSRRIRLRELLLLALRTAIVLLAALAAARPMWRSAGSIGLSQERTHYIVVVDQSMSMAARTDGATRLERAQQQARQILENAAAGDAFTVIAWAERADNVLGRPTFEPSEAIEAIESVEPLDTVADLAAAARAVETAAREAKRAFPGLTRTRPILLSDLASNTWEAAIASEQQMGDRRTLPASAEIVSVDDGVRDNVALTALTLEPAAPILDRPVETAVHVRAFGHDNASDVSVELFVDGNRVGRQQSAVASGGEWVIRFETRLIEPGRHVIEARLSASEDLLAPDNRRWLVIEARQSRRALLVADVATAAEDIARALNPRYREASGGDAIQVEIASTANLVRTELSEYDAVFLCNVAELSDREQRLVERYIRGGGAVVLVLGDRTRAAAYDELLQPDGTLTIAEQSVQGEWRLDPLDYRHPMIAPFAGRGSSGLLGVRVSKYYPVQVAESDRAEIPLAFSSGDPAVVIISQGTGRLAVLATDPTLETNGAPWSTLAVSPSFVPLVREMFDYLTADHRGDLWNRVAGEQLSVSSAADPDAAGKPEWTDPQGNVSATPPDSRRSGVYTVGGAPIAVNIDPAESDLQSIALADLEKSATVAGADARNSLFEGATRPLAAYLLGAAAVLMLVELTVAWLLGRGWA